MLVLEPLAKEPARMKSVTITAQNGRAFGDASVAGVFASYSEATCRRLLQVRELIFEAASEQSVGRIEETLKWGQPSYLTPETRSGSTIRVDAVKNDPDRYAVYFHCQTELVENFRRLYPDRFISEGNRALHFSAADELPATELKHCLSLALTYHKRSKQAALGRAKTSPDRAEPSAS